ncbi:expansin-A3-like [Zingiber officinale]|uniref:Expansin n=1 Tax=Zingiber officinale TaxID=94328 RepID=A0A8J5EYZ4_ZINOF|nr:expansin-A3-like [Zingiber officinale]KAG6476031.1 hypothetical protein ZIOFF_065266 [Zingiber officinale]
MDIVNLVTFVILLTASATMMVGAQSQWAYDAHATFYGDMSGGETMQGACGYGDLNQQGYGLKTAALSTALFSDGAACGACYEIECVDSPEWCAPGRSVSITATNFCPPNPALPNDNGGWCNPPRKHFDLSMPMFVEITKDYHAGIVPVRYRRVPCFKIGGIRFELGGNPNFLMVLVFNVGGAGDVSSLEVKGSRTGWMGMVRNWGQKWDLPGQPQLVGQALSFRVTLSDRRSVVSDDVAPAQWQFGQTVEGKQF